MAKVFFSYSHKDAAQRDQLEEHLSLMKNQGLIEGWHDTKIEVGSEFDPEIQKNLEASEVILLLISAHFMASNYCYSKEMARAIERHKADEALVIPVILKPCDWHSSPFGGIKAAPEDGKAVSLWADTDEAYADVAKKVRSAIEARMARSGARATPPDVQRQAATAPGFGLPRSSNLRLKKEFTQQDRDSILRDGFAFIERFFEGSLLELEQRNPGIKGRFEKIDARRFTAIIYNQGNTAAQCQVFMQSGFGGGGGIAYSSSISDRGNSYNESIHVEADDQSMYFQAMGVQFSGSSRTKHLSAEGAAELFWGMLIHPLQGNGRSGFG